MSIIIPLCANVWHAQVLIYEIERRGTHTALCECNELEQSVGPGAGEDQESSVCVFLLTAPGPLWNRTRRGDCELRAALQVAVTGVNWKLLLVASAREALAPNHRGQIHHLKDFSSAGEYFQTLHFEVDEFM